MLTPDQMAERYGEMCSKAKASRIMGYCVNTITNMINDGRLEAVCGGKRVDVRSIARFMANPAKANEEARVRKIKMRRNMDFAV